jgi:hypothetical protein
MTNRNTERINKSVDALAQVDMRVKVGTHRVFLRSGRWLWKRDDEITLSNHYSIYTLRTSIQDKKITYLPKYLLDTYARMLGCLSLQTRSCLCTYIGRSQVFSRRRLVTERGRRMKCFYGTSGDSVHRLKVR